MVVRVIHAPDRVIFESGVTIFLGGSIENGKAIDWQTELISKIKSCEGKFNDKDVNLINPRRVNWSGALEYSLDNEVLVNQILYELHEISKVDILFMYFAGDTISPISLLELGIALGSKKNVVVVCDENYFRRANVVLTCYQYDVKVYDSINDAFDQLLRKIANV